MNMSLRSYILYIYIPGLHFGVSEDMGLGLAI